ncbi:hypothetical protein [Streptomyces sp. NPDC090025]|uniref:hypothetical protein n=1 Tax=Streptomyces sp. NPDC090025 TaxID=3365922 RepID=UPI003835CD65
MRKLWACGLVLGMAGLVGCAGGSGGSGGASDASDTSKNSASPSAKPSPAVTLTISGSLAVELPTGKGPADGERCKAPSGSRLKAGAKVRVTDSGGKVLGSDRLNPGTAFGSSTLMLCRFPVSFKVPGASATYVLSVEGFPPLTYTREDIRRGLDLWESDGKLEPQ